MAKWKEPSLTEETALVTAVDPRVRMKEIRAMVSNHLKGKAVSEDLGFLAHLGDLPDNMADARRVIIAVQDEAEDARERHRKATAHITELVHLLDHMAEFQNELYAVMDVYEAQIRDLDQRVKAETDYSRKVSQAAQQSHYERDAVLTTMKLLNSQQLQPSTVNVAVGYSNKDQG